MAFEDESEEQVDIENSSDIGKRSEVTILSFSKVGRLGRVGARKGCLVGTVPVPRFAPILDSRDAMFKSVSGSKSDKEPRRRRGAKRTKVEIAKNSDRVGTNSEIVVFSDDEETAIFAPSVFAADIVQLQNCTSECLPLQEIADNTSKENDLPEMYYQNKKSRPEDPKPIKLLSDPIQPVIAPIPIVSTIHVPDPVQPVSKHIPTVSTLHVPLPTQPGTQSIPTVSTPTVPHPTQPVIEPIPQVSNPSVPDLIQPVVTKPIQIVSTHIVSDLTQPVTQPIPAIDTPSVPQPETSPGPKKPPTRKKKRKLKTQGPLEDIQQLEPPQPLNQNDPLNNCEVLKSLAEITKFKNRRQSDFLRKYPASPTTKSQSRKNRQSSTACALCFTCSCSNSAQKRQQQISDLDGDPLDLKLIQNVLEDTQIERALIARLARLEKSIAWFEALRNRVHRDLKKHRSKINKNLQVRLARQQNQKTWFLPDPDHDIHNHPSHTHAKKTETIVSSAKRSIFASTRQTLTQIVPPQRSSKSAKTLNMLNLENDTFGSQSEFTKPHQSDNPPLPHQTNNFDYSNIHQQSDAYSVISTMSQNEIKLYDNFSPTKLCPTSSADLWNASKLGRQQDLETLLRQSSLNPISTSEILTQQEPSPSSGGVDALIDLLCCQETEQDEPKLVNINPAG